MYFERFELPNGLRVLTAPMPGVRSVTTAVFIGAGSRYEDDRESGIAHFIEHMLFKGTDRRRSPQAVSATIERVGGILNASTDKESTVFWTKTAGPHFELGVDLIADMIQHSRLLTGEVARERGVIVEELRMTFDDPQDWVHGLIDEVMWPNHPLGKDVGGTPESVSGITRASIRRFMATYYGASNAVVVVAGGVEPSRVERAVAAHLGEWRRVSPRPPREAPITADSTRWRLETKPTEQMNFCLAFPGVSTRDPDRYAFDLLASILGGSMTSRLFVEVRERRALAYDIHAYTNKLADTGAMVVYAGVDARRAVEALETILRQIEKIRRRGVTDEELERTKEYFKGRLYLGLEDTQAVASWLGSQELLLGKIESPEAVVAALEAVTTRDIRALARDRLDRSLARLAAIGPNSADVIASLAA